MDEMTTVVIALDPGQTTGWAITSKKGTIIGCGNWQPEEIIAGLEWLIRLAREHGELDAIVEDTPPNAPLTTSLRLIRELIFGTIKMYEVRYFVVKPGHWMVSRAAMTYRPPLAWDGFALTQHQKDALGLAAYYWDPGPQLARAKAGTWRPYRAKTDG